MLENNSEFYAHLYFQLDEKEDIYKKKEATIGNTQYKTPVPKITEEEICTALRRTKNGKAQSLEGIPIKLVKHSSALVIETLSNIFNMFITRA